jgi:hypothetical protein
MTYVLIDKKEKKKEECDNKFNLKSDSMQIYLIFHIILTCVAVYLSHKCNRGYNVVHFLLAFFFPYVYIIYMLAIRGLCN